MTRRKTNEKPVLRRLERIFYLTSANGISEDGQLVNVDGNGNRIAGADLWSRACPCDRGE